MGIIDSYIKNIEKELKSQKSIKVEEVVGEVIEVKDGVAILVGLNNVTYGEIVEFDSGEKGFVIDLNEDSVGVVILGDFLKIKAGEMVKASGKQVSVPVSNEILGRTVNALGMPIDGGDKIKLDKLYPVEKIAPGIVYRKPVSVPLQTGIKAIDALVPIGRGQRELIIGDRGTGKSTVVIDTILNQKGKDVICIYCAVGQKESNVAWLIDVFKKHFNIGFGRNNFSFFLNFFYCAY